MADTEQELVEPALAGNLIGTLTPVCIKAGMSIGECSILAADLIRNLRSGGFVIVRSVSGH